MNTWEFWEVEKKFTKIVQNAMKYGPQLITKEGVETVVIISKREYNELINDCNELTNILRAAPKVDMNPDRDQDTIRNIQT